MVKKIKISDLAKDLNVPGNDIAELMGEYSEVKKKPSSTLNEEEINLVLEHYTQQNQVASFDAYFDQRNRKDEPVQVKEEEPQKPEKKAVKSGPDKKTEENKSDKSEKPEKPKQEVKTQEKAAEKKNAPEKKTEPAPAPAPQKEERKSNDDK